MITRMKKDAFYVSCHFTIPYIAYIFTLFDFPDSYVKQSATLSN